MLISADLTPKLVAIALFHEQSLNKCQIDFSTYLSTNCEYLVKISPVHSQIIDLITN